MTTDHNMLMTNTYIDPHAVFFVAYVVSPSDLYSIETDTDYLLWGRVIYTIFRAGRLRQGASTGRTRLPRQKYLPRRVEVFCALDLHGMLPQKLF